MRRIHRHKPGTGPVKDRCGPTGKARYRSFGAALETKRRLLKERLHERDGKRQESRVYYCRKCDGYHLTSQPKYTAPLRPTEEITNA